MMRIGFGFDVHQLTSGNPLWIGGVKVPFDKGAVAHSDGDVLIHALCDALLGAADLRDIGFHFSDQDEQYKNIDSKILLSKTLSLICDEGYTFCNTDITLVIQKPKMKDWIPSMKDKLAEVMQCSPRQISIKATTSEYMGFEGRGDGVSCYAVVLIQPSSE